MKEKEKLILKTIKANHSESDTVLAAQIITKYPIFKDMKYETLRRRINMARHEHNLVNDKITDWEKVFNEYEKLAKKYPQRPIAVIASGIAKKIGLTEKWVRTKLYYYRRYGLC